MAEIEGLAGKAFEFTIKWTIDVPYALEEGTEEYLDNLRQIGSAEVTDIKLIDKPK